MINITFAELLVPNIQLAPPSDHAREALNITPNLSQAKDLENGVNKREALEAC